MNNLLIYSPQASPRLKYVCDWLFTEQLGLSYTLIHDGFAAAHICYGAVKNGGINIPDAGLLWQKDIRQQKFAIGAWNFIPTLYHQSEDNLTLPFDIFSAIFFLLSRYEEYYPFTPDKHGRYPANESILFQLHLERPVIAEWVASFAETLQVYNTPVKQKAFSFVPSYDIDIAWSYKHKGWQRNAGGLVKDIFKLDLTNVAQRILTLCGKADPYDAFPRMAQLHRQYHLSPLFFLLVAQQVSAFDKNISPAHPAMQHLIKNLATQATLGIHPSYHSSTKPDLIAEERNLLADISKSTINKSRQHYIRFSLPDTYRELIENDICDDYSMGYATHLGFRAGTGSSFLWYDIEREIITNLRIHPFCFMDTTARFEMGMNPDEAFERLLKMADILRRTHSTLITVFHNFSLGTDSGWKGWYEGYEQFISKMK